jgi:threonine synthase
MYAAMANIACDIFVPADTSDAKLAQMQLYRAQLHKIYGSREDTAEAALKAAEKHYYASHCWNPFFFQGTKTFAYEVCEQLDWQAPDAVVLPVGNGTLLIGCFIGFTELMQAGIISHMPKLIAVQSKNCAPLFEAFHRKEVDIHDIQTLLTLAEGIAIAKPVRARQMLDMVRKTQGNFIAVDEDEIIDALKLCGKMGFYIEPTSAATIAGLRTYLKQNEEERVVSLFSGHGLKSTEKILKIMNAY